MGLCNMDYEVAFVDKPPYLYCELFLYLYHGVSLSDSIIIKQHVLIIFLASWQLM
jgi:hypothetical protein